MRVIVGHYVGGNSGGNLSQGKDQLHQITIILIPLKSYTIFHSKNDLAMFYIIIQCHM